MSLTDFDDLEYPEDVDLVERLEKAKVEEWKLLAMVITSASAGRPIG